MSHRYRSFVRLLTLCLFCITCSMPIVYADTLTIPNTFTAGTPAQATQVNSNFNAVASWSANIANDNIKSGAAIAPSKLDLSVLVFPTSEWFFRRSSSNRCVSSGVTGDTVPRVTLTSDGYLQFGAGSASAVDIGVRRKSSSLLQVVDGGITASKSLEALGFESTTFGDANPKVKLDTSGLHFGAGGVGAVDTLLKRSDATTLAVRDAADSADAALTVGNLTASGTVSVTGTTTLNSTLTANAVVPGIRPGGRLTLTSGTPVTGDVTGASTLYYTPYVSNLYPAYSTSSGKYTAKAFTEASLTLSISANTNYDIFGVYTSGSAPTLSAVAWTNDTTRATALVRSATTCGLLVKNGDAESLYLGTIRGSGANVTAKSRAAGQLYVWNMYNRVVEDALAQDTTDLWTYTTATYQEARAQSTEGTSRIGIVRGLDEDSIEANNIAVASNSTANTAATCGIGLDSSTVNSAINGPAAAGANIVFALNAFYRGKPGIGYHTLRRLEQSTAAGTCSWGGDGGGTVYQTGLRVSQPM